MRPVRLKVKGFTSFRDEQTIDFSGLEIFAIAGPTGSGKSSLLDAMTYALYGEVDRVSNQCGQLVSQGQARMTVTLDFRVGTDDFRITRSTPAKGAGHVLLQRLVNGEERTYGEGADRAHEVKKIVAKIVGLDYDAFTRSVLLPQNKFADFLTGEPRKRRDILIELLGLELFDRMLKRANGIKADAKTQAEAKAAVVAREYAGADADAVHHTREEANAASEREEKLGAAVEEVSMLAKQWEDMKRRADGLAECAGEAKAMATTVQSAVDALNKLAADVASADALVLRRLDEEKEAARLTKLADAALLSAETKLGKLANLVRAKVFAERLPSLKRTAEGAATQVTRSQEKLPKLQDLLERRDEAVNDAAAKRKQMAKSLADAKKALLEAEHADKVAALVADRKRGDPCPICGQPLQTIPKSSLAVLRAARTAVDSAEEGNEAADEALNGAKMARQEADNTLAQHRTDQTRLKKEALGAAAAVSECERELATLLGGKLPADPASTAGERIMELERLAKLAKGAAAAFTDAERAHASEREKRTRLDAGIAQERARLEVKKDALFGRLVTLGVDTKDVPTIAPLPPIGRGIDAMVAAGRTATGALTQLGKHLSALASGLLKSEDNLVNRALKAAEGTGADARDLLTLRKLIVVAERKAVAAAAEAKQRLADLEKRLQNRLDLEREIEQLEHRAQVFAVLALELRADHLVAFLQAEALQAMASAASVHLIELSEQRYTLVCRDDDEFFVVDQWCGDEERSVRTLSGGETFLASLSLALALAEQVRALSTSGRARLDSLFLDEGFGSLDPDALRIVTGAIHHLAGDGRLVGVVTHIRELAEQFVRIQVEKSPRGSTLRLVS